jgi:uncharacterized repeat protein (TIGR01451 family)
MLLNHLATKKRPVAWILLLGVVSFWQAPSLAQEDELPKDYEKGNGPNVNVFSKLFGSSTTKKPAGTATPAESAPEKRKVPAQTTSGKTNRGGLFVPLKSFTKAFRGPSEADIEETIEDPQPTMIAPRIPREPFRNLPRVSERRDRNTEELQVESVPTLPTSPQSKTTERYTGSLDPKEKPIDGLSRSKDITPKSAPIVRGEPAPVAKPPITKPTGSTTSEKTVGRPPATVRGTPEKRNDSPKSDFVIESSSTSRRAKNTVDLEPAIPTTESLAEIVSSKKSKSAVSSPTSTESSTKRAALPDNLLELGESLQSTNNTATKPAIPEIKDAVLPVATTEQADRAETTRSAPIPLPAFPDEAKKTQMHPPVSTVSKSGSGLIGTRPSEREAYRMASNATGTNSKPDMNRPSNALPDKSRLDLPSSAHASNERLYQEMSLPGVRVSIQGPDAMSINKECIYEIVAKNEGSEALNGLAMRVSVPHQVVVRTVSTSVGVTQPDNDKDGNAVVWELDNIPAGGTQTAKLALQTAKPEHFALGLEWTLLPQSKETQILVQQPQLAIALEGPSEVEFGKPQMYRVRVRNAGNADVRDVSVALSAEPYGSNQSDIGDVAAGSERIIDVELTFQQSGKLPIKASAASIQSELKAESSIDVEVRQSQLDVQWRGPSEFYQGGIADYEIEITNHGAIAALGTICKFVLPVGAESMSMPVGAVRKGDLVQWEIKRLEPQEKAVFPIKLAMNKMGQNRLVASAECVTSLDAKSEHVTTVDSIADLHLSVSDPIAPAPVGQHVTYEITIVNRGKKAANDVEVVAQFSEGIEPVKVAGQTGTIVPGQAIFQPITSIGPNEKKVLKVVAEASTAGVHRFRAEVKCVGSDADLLEEESTRFIATGTRSDRR